MSREIELFQDSGQERFTFLKLSQQKFYLKPVLRKNTANLGILLFLFNPFNQQPNLRSPVT